MAKNPAIPHACVNQDVSSREGNSAPRFGGSGLGVACAVLAALVLGFGLPSNLFGSAPTDRPITVEAAQIRVFDGETLGLGDRIIRLAGIAAPARGEACGSDAGVFAHGDNAREI